MSDDIEARGVAEAFLQALGTGRFDDAYGMMTPEQPGDVALFARQMHDLAEALGKPIRRVYTKTTWTAGDGPPVTPRAGVYAAIDVQARYTRASRTCGYVVLFRSDGDRRFRVARHEVNFLPDATAERIEREQGADAARAAWAALARNCPNFVEAVRP